MINRVAIVALAAALLGSPASASSKPKTLEELFLPLSQGTCVKIDDVRSIGATVQLTPEQFQFVRAFWIALPPVSRELPPGSAAFFAKDPNGYSALGLIDDDGQVCAAFKAEDWLERLVGKVGLGETGKRGQAL